ncbi:DUF2793 domain-containing protein [Sphingomonas sp. 2R-10]|uniref:DUF2793 domain-containing protein n=1 Tax=Sphingomonas sp. 2R-10 TaxID=3045148 RepID=UPI000F776E15|nr:DUF2793 domain-containing protein [Sphingomonas sp. 2R-10]MDJ0276411.1 DUF2793 domain-containing protein [Sphingomonas sp. 2R-10]
MTDQTSRLSLPLLHIAQAQKEMTHNEALTLIDLLLHGCVEGVAQDTPPATAEPGRCWIVGPAPGGAWAGRAGQIAGMTGGGWRFMMPREGMTLWWIGGETTLVFRGGAWRQGEVRAARIMVDGVAVVGPQRAAIAVPDGGTVRDEEARTALAAILGALRDHGLIAR